VIAKILMVAMATITLSMSPAVTQQQAATGLTAITITGVDSHDGMIYQDNGAYFWVGTKYGCGFVWMAPATPWCGFGVWTATTAAGPWTYVRDLFDPAGTSAPQYFSETWQQICRGDGCFNPRMTRRTDGVWVLWFNAPRDQVAHGGNQFWAMGCNGPAGPCGAAAGAPYGGTFKPPLWICNSGGDFSILDDVGVWYLFCGTAQHTISVERLQPWGTTGTGVGASNLAGLSYVEGAGVFRTGAQYALTYGGNCPYCSGADTSYAVSTSPLGPYMTPPGAAGRRVISGGSCGGQPRTVVTLDGVTYEQVDHWYDGYSQPAAATSLFPLVQTGALLQPADGLPWSGFAPFQCGGQP
jgi:hypothetical protein